MDSATDKVEIGARYARIGYWILFCIAFLTFTVALISYCCALRYHNKGGKAGNWGRSCLVIFVILLILLWILCFILLVGVVAMSTACGLVRSINEGS